MRFPPLAVLLVVATLLASAFAGCLSETSKGDPTISRVHTMTISRATVEAASEHEDDPMAALREMLSTDLVVRVLEEGDYTLDYTDAHGEPRSFPITGASPGTPVVVTGADPIAPAVLKQGEKTISVRAGIAADWWHLGDIPLGFNLTGASKTTYDFDMRMEETFTLTDLELAQMDVSVQSLAFSLLLPVEGSASWELQPDTGEGSPVLLKADIGIARGAGDLMKLDVVATQADQPGTAGLVSGVDEARGSASAKVWFRDGQPTAAQFLGSEYKVVPRATMWADGFFAELAGDSAPVSCIGASKADQCVPEELETLEDTEPAGAKETFDSADFPKAEDDEAREAVQIMQRLFAQDILPGDKGIVRAMADEDDIGAGVTGPTGDFLFEFTIEAVELEEIDVPAGSFDALKIVEIARTRVNVKDLDDPEGNPLIDDYSLDETIARTTFWLDSTTYQPLKMEATTPFDAEAVLKDALDAIDDSAWDQIGGKPIEDSQWSLTALAESSYEATDLEPGAHFSALVGLALAHTLTGGSGVAPMWIMGSAAGYGALSGFGSQSYPEAARPAMSLSLVSAGALADGVKPYTVASVSPGVSWGDMMITLDGEDLWLEPSDEGCAAPTEGYTVCRGDQSLYYGEEAQAGDTMRIVAASGQTLRILDPYSNSVMLTLTVR